MVKLADLITPNGFNDVFESFLPECESKIEAYYKTEEIYKKEVGDTKYSSYNSFRVVRERILRKK